MKSRFLTLLRNPLSLTLLALIAIIPIATALYMSFEGWPLLNALNFVLSLVTTVGNSNVYPSHISGQLFTAFMLILGIAVIVVTLSTYATRLIDLVSRGVNVMERNEQALAALQEHIVVVAENNLADLLTQNLQAKESPFSVITQDEELFNRRLEEGIPTVLGNPDEEDVLRRAGVERAAGLIVALPSDADNVFVVLSAHDLNPRMRIAARAHTASSIPKLRRSGADEVVLPEQITAINLVELLQTRKRMGALMRQVNDELRWALKERLTTPAGEESQPERVLFRALRLALLELSPDMEATLQALGEQFGREAVGPNLSGNRLCELLGQLAPLWSSAGLGEITVARCDEESALLEEAHCATCEGLPNVGKPVCHLERGVITGALEVALGRTVKTKETKCWGMGNQACEFEITTDLHLH